MAKSKTGQNLVTRNTVVKGNRANVRPFIDGREYDHFMCKTFECNESIETTELPRLNGAPVIVPGDPTYEGSFTDYFGSPLFLQEVSAKFKKTGQYPQVDFLIDYIDTGSDRGAACYEVTGVILTQTPYINIDVESPAVEGSFNFSAEDCQAVEQFDYVQGER